MNKLQLITGTILLTSSLCLSASDVKPKLWYTFENGMAEDQSGNGYHGTLKGSAKIREFGDKSTLYLGYDKGYLDMGENVG